MHHKLASSILIAICWGLPNLVLKLLVVRSHYCLCGQLIAILLALLNVFSVTIENTQLGIYLGFCQLHNHESILSFAKSSGMLG
jgi:hypothetical protein